MNTAEPSPPSDPLQTAAREAAALHVPSDRPARAVPVWGWSRLMPQWLERAREASFEPSADTAKAAEWLLDNDYQIQRALQQIREDMPSGFYVRLPSLATGEEAGFPRVFAIAHTLLRASRLQLSLDGAARFVEAYQENAPLTIAELWAFPTMLRLVCLEILVSAFGRLFPSVRPPFEATRSASHSDGFEDTEAASRALATLGLVASIPWKDFFDRVSRVEASLSDDPAEFYPMMDFDTRDRYRSAVEDLAIRAGRSEADVAAAALAKCRSVSGDRLRTHVGHWLVGNGRGEFEKSLECRIALPRRLGRLALRHAGPLYAAGLVAVALLGLIVPAIYLATANPGLPLWLFGIVLALLPASILAVTVVHWVVMLSVPPRVLPKLDFRKGIPPDCATAVVMPVLVAGASEIPALIERLEAHRLANPDPALHFALLSDHADAPSERMPGDDDVERALIDGVKRLNRRYGTGGYRPFHLLHRRRRHSHCQACWMGWERKRGKLDQFNRFVLGEDVSDFSLHEGEPDALRQLRFVVTVDADTTIPHGAVARLVGTLAHPLNTARHDPATGRVMTGYTVVQPRVEITPESGIRSLFARLYTGDTAIDIYSRAVSDVYQDLFGTGIFIGKGVYEIAPFQRSIEGRVPENALVSHDLFEGLQGRAALASDIVLYEGFPTGYVEYTRRWHRWVRGDWQLLPWLARRVPASDGGQRPNQLSGVDRWKIIDNLRRSLVPVSLVALAAAGWLVLPGSPWLWTALTLAAPGAYLFTDLASGLARGRRRGAVRSAFRRSVDHLGRWFLAIVFLVHDAVVALDAIARTLWRLSVSRRNLLEWTSAAHTAVRFAGGGSRADAWRHMWPAPALSVMLGTAVAIVDPAALIPAAPLLLAWLASPEIAVRISRPLRGRSAPLNAADQAYLRRIARRTWLYFETFVGPEDNWLPPDNYQEEPHEEIAHRTSPTNVAMLLLSSMSAWDLGFLGPKELSIRLRSALDTLDRLEHHRGHMLNWYDSRTLEPLEPRYVSTVDSGNLAVCLLALVEGCADVTRAPVLRHHDWDGLGDAVALLKAALEGAAPGAGEQIAMLTEITDRIARARGDPTDWRDALQRLRGTDWPVLEAAVGQVVAGQSGMPARKLREAQVWMDRARHHLATMQRDRETFRPWETLVEAPPATGMHIAGPIVETLPPTLALADAPAAFAHAQSLLAAFVPAATDAATVDWMRELGTALELGASAHRELRDALSGVASRSERMAFAMDFRFLFDDESRLFHIGYNLSFDRIDPHHYDLLATEARLASYFAIAKGDVPVEHWFFLGRPMMQTMMGPALVSWNGSMFEYLMPPLLMRSDPGSLLGQSERAAVALQHRYAQDLGIPWGISESAYASRDVEHRYRYRAFGVPGLGLRRGLERDLVVAPYATALALAVNPHLAIRNLRALDRAGGSGVFGFLEALDFTGERRVGDREFVPVDAYMAHHQGMALAAIDNVLCDNAMVRRFHADPRMKAVELLLHERVPWEFPPEIERFQERERPAAKLETTPPAQPWIPRAANMFPQVHTLGNGRCASWITEAGGGGLWWQGRALTRWRPDTSRDDHGVWIYVGDEDSGALWSIGRQPTGTWPADARVVFHPHMAEFHRQDHGIAVGMEVTVVGGDDVEIRRITVTNHSEHRRSLRFTSLGEVVLAPAAEDERHPAFMKLFVGGEHLPNLSGLLFERRPRHPGETPPVLLHRVVADDAGVGSVGYDCDRATVLGRHGNPGRPIGVLHGLSDEAGWTLDPVMSLQVKLSLAPRESRRFAFLTMAAGSRDSVLEVAERYATLGSLEWALSDVASGAIQEVRRLGLDPHHLRDLQTLASLLLYPHPALRADPDTILANHLGQPRLWTMGLSGDLPILLLRTDGSEDFKLLQLLVRGYLLWRRRAVEVDLVILRVGASGYVEPARDQLLTVLREAGAQEFLGRKGGIHLVFADQIAREECRLLEAVARVVLDGGRGTLGQQLATATAEPDPEPVAFRPTDGPARETTAPDIARPSDLLFDNGIGGFTADGREYVIHLGPDQATPAPWANILANDDFGTIVTEAGTGFTWAVNSGENRLTPWSNDPVVDPAGEALYLRDEETADTWTPTPQPAGRGTCQIRHGAGYTKWHGGGPGIEHELLVFVPVDDPIKIIRLRLRNLLPEARRVTATYYAEWVLGALPSRSKQLVVCEYDPVSHALTARNPWNPDFGERVAFLTSNQPPHSLTTDRQAFLGREGDPATPAGLRRWDLGGLTPAGADPCAALQVHLDIAPGATAEVVFVLGQGRDRPHMLELAQRWRDLHHVGEALGQLHGHWDKLLGAVRVRTPDPAFDLMVNRWLPYQTISSRLRARAGFYQAGGAIGFRDQLQDVLSMLHADPGRVRAHILACAARQFEEGDVLHWWHPPTDRGVRTRCSDDLLWLPYVTSGYIEATGDETILHEEIPFLRARPLAPEEDDRYARFEPASDLFSLFEHCRRALDRGVTQGAHGLPLIGSGDWNDGMDRVGRRMLGESVWLAWFSIAVMDRFSDLSSRLGRDDLERRWTAQAVEMRQAVEHAGWDGQWYLRAFDDDGRPWGSAENEECRIDLIAQSWSVLANKTPSERSRAAVEAAATQLMAGGERVIRLLWPPFDTTSRDPGYIKAYPPGIRENGGQYTHAAAWLGFAFAGLGDGERAAQVFDRVNPINHSSTPDDAARYRTEPYVIAADVAGVDPHVGRGGWTWYTGSAAWVWRLGVEQILGLRLVNGDLLIEPCLPKGWREFEATVAGPQGWLEIRVEDPDRVGSGVAEILADGTAHATSAMAFPTDGSKRHVLVRLGPASAVPDTDSEAPTVSGP